MSEGKFNIRVYGLLINDENQVLISDEYVLDTFMSKFPGGGLDYGEGPEDCILREALEEFGQEVEIERHFYTTGFFQPTIFFIDQQLISIYYKIKLKGSPRFNISERKFDFTGKINGNQSFRWVPVNELNKEELTFPVDRHVAGLLMKEYV